MGREKKRILHGKIKRKKMQYGKTRREEDLIIDISKIEEEKHQNVFILIIISIISSFSGYMGFSDGFEIGSSLFCVFSVAVLFSAITQLLLRDRKSIQVGMPIMVGVIGAYIAITAKWTLNGFTLIINQIINYVNQHKAEMHIKYVASYETKELDILLAAIVICAVYVVVFNVLLKYKRIFVCGFLLLAASMSNMIVGGEGHSVWIAISLICVFVVFYISNIRILKMKKTYGFNSVLFIVLICISIVFVIFVRYTKIRFVEELKDEIIYQTGNIIYGKSDYPEGQFKRFDNVINEDENTRLTVSTTDAISLHLKGYVGCQYTEKGWKGNDENVYGGDNLGMLDWFLEQGYYPLTQPAYYMGYSRNDGRDIGFDKVVNSSIHVVNNTASKKYEYVSENLLDMSGLIDPKQDVNFVETDLFGEEEYWYDILYFTEEDYIKFPSQQWFENSSDDAGEANQFVQAENYYHGFAYEQYLKIPVEEEKILKENIPACNNNVADAISTVRSYLREQIKYSEECMAYNPKKNYLSQVLLEDKRGYSVHYSTIATLMFRYYGVPARYVEGYWMPNEDEKETVEIKNTDAHAWVEIYIKGLGFVPVEVTPGYYQEEEIGTGASIKKHNPQKQNSGGSTGTKKNDKEHINITLEMAMAAIAILLGLCVVCLTIILVIRRKIIVAIRKKRLKSKDKYMVVAVASDYINDICKFNGSLIENEIPDNVRIILEKVKFSNHSLQDEEKNCVCECMNTILRETWNKQSLGKKMVMMFIKGLK